MWHSLILKDFSAVCCCCCCCRPCHSQDPAVPRVSWTVLLKRPCWQHVDRPCLDTDSAVVRGQQHAGHRLDYWSETPTESNLAHDNFFLFFFFLGCSRCQLRKTQCDHMTPKSQEPFHSSSCHWMLLFFNFIQSSDTGSYPPTPHQISQHGCQPSPLPFPLSFHLTFPMVHAAQQQHITNTNHILNYTNNNGSICQV